MSRRSGTTIRTKVYNKFKGVDFSTDPALVADYRSPYAVNLWADSGGMPEKRPGARCVHKITGQIVNEGYITALFTRNRSVPDATNVVKKVDGASAQDLEFEINTSVFYEKTGWTGNIKITSTVGDGETIENGAGDKIEHVIRSDFGYSIGTIEGDEAVITFTISCSDREKIALYRSGTAKRFEDSGFSQEISMPEILFNMEMSDAVPVGINFGSHIFIFTGAGLYVYDGSQIKDVCNHAYVPLVLIGCEPAGGGTKYEDINIITGAQKVSFLADGTSTEYHLPYTGITSVDKITVNSVETEDYTEDLTNGTVTFTTAPAAPAAGAADNVVIWFTKNVAGSADKIKKCRTAICWGFGGARDRIICTGNPDYPNIDFICEYNNPYYWPDLNYSVVGSEQTGIMGYRRAGEDLAIIKEDNGKDTTIFIRSGAFDEDGNTIFTVKPCLSGAGAVSFGGFGNIGDDQMFLTGRGVQALTTKSLTAEKIVQPRSLKIDPKLTKEDLSKAFCISFRDMLLIICGNRIYGLDGKQQKSYEARTDTEFTYECFYWEFRYNILAAMTVVKNGVESLYLGMSSPRHMIMKLNTDVEGMAAFSDEMYRGTGRLTVPIEAIWSTRMDDDGDPMIYKTMLKKGNAVTLKPYTRSSAKICLRTDKDPVDWQASYGEIDILDWEDIDFERFTFDSNDSAREVPLGRKVKNYKRLQFVVKNDSINEGFGVYQITKHFVTGNFAKR